MSHLQFDIWLHLSSMETHWPSSQVNCPELQAVTLTLTSLEAREEVQGSSGTREKSNMCTPSSSESSSDGLRGVRPHEPHQHLTSSGETNIFI